MSQLVTMVPSLADQRVRRAARRAGLIGRAPSERDDWTVCSSSALAVVADIIAQGTDPVAVTEWFGRLNAHLSAAAAEIPAGLEGVSHEASMVELLRRNRAPLSRAVATLFVKEVGNNLTTSQRSAVRIGAVDDRRPPRTD